MIWTNIFDHDAHKIVSNRGKEVLSKKKQKDLLIKLMREDAKNGVYED